MSHLIRLHRSSRLLLSTAVAILLVMGMLSASPAAAHNFTKTDGNDSPGRLDIRTASVSHTSTSVVHRIATYNAWSSQSLGNDSFFVIQIDKNNDRVYERCAFIFNTNRLRGSLSNCGAKFIRYLPVAKLSGTAARVTIPKSETGSVYWWGAASLWDGAAPCRDGCVDFLPNRFPDILHDLIRPTVVVDEFLPISTELSASTSIPISFTATDLGGSGVETWKVQSAPAGQLPWTTRDEGTGRGDKTANIVLQQGETYDIRVVAWDRHGNFGTSASRRLTVPIDETDPIMSFSGSWIADTSDAEYFQSTHHQGDGGDSVTFTVTGENISIISGPGTGTVIMTVNGSSGTTFYMSETRSKRAVAHHHSFGARIIAEITLTVQAGSTFVFDGVAVR